MEENLLGYLLGALDGAEHDEIEEKVSRDSGLRDELAALEEKLAMERLRRAREQMVEEQEAFDRALKVMADVYASAVGTTVLQLKEIPPRPKEFGRRPGLPHPEPPQE